MADATKKYQKIRVRRTVYLDVLIPLDLGLPWEQATQRAFEYATSWLFDGKKLPGVSVQGGGDYNVETAEEVMLPADALDERPSARARLLGFLYDLMRDHVPLGVVGKLVQQNEKNDDAVSYTNGHLRAYAEEVIGRLLPPEGATHSNMAKLDHYIANLRRAEANGYKEEIHDPGRHANFLEFCLGRRQSP